MDKIISKEIKILGKLRLRIGIDHVFWTIAIGIGQPHSDDGCHCVGVAAQFIPFFFEIFIARVDHE